MMKKSVAFVLIGLLVVSLAAVAMASPMGFGMMRGNGMMGPAGPGSQTTLTDEQKADWKAYHEKAIDVKKEFLQRQVVSGAVTQEQADLQIKWMQQRFEQQMNGRPALTEQQKADFKAYNDKMVDLRKEFMQQQVTRGVITQEQADQRIQWMQQRAEQHENGTMGHRGNQKGFGGRGNCINQNTAVSK